MQPISKQHTATMMAVMLVMVALASGCQSSLFQPQGADFATLLKESGQEQVWERGSVKDRLAKLAGEENSLAPNTEPKFEKDKPHDNLSSAPNQYASYSPQQQSLTTTSIVRGQSPAYGGDDNSFSPDGVGQSTPSNSNTKDSGVKPVAYQYPEFATPGRANIPGNGLPSPNIGSPNELNPLVHPFEHGGNAPFPANYADLDVYVAETETGRINFGGAYNSDNGIVGQFTIDEKNFDITRFPRSWRDIRENTAFKGAGQTFRLELAPGANLERYLVSFTEPFLLGTDYSFSASGYLFDRQYFDWDERRLGGRFSVGRRLTRDLSISAGVRLESVTIDNPRTDTSQELNNSLGTSNLFLGNIGLVRDTRDSQVLATQGSYLALTYSQAFGDFSFARGDVDYRRYKLLYERPDGSGRHTLSFGTKLGFSGSSTPIFENYFAGGFATLRGFEFRGAAPLEGGVRVGGEFQWLNTVEYMFPVTASDMVKGVLFCDFGTVEQSIEINSENFRVAPGFGFRIHTPGGGGLGAPLAFDFAFPVASAEGDEEKIFAFFLGVSR